MAFKPISSTLKLAVAGLALGLMFNHGVRAGSNNSGALAGRATAGAKVVVHNPKTGFARTITVPANGRFRVAQLPLGTYVVTVRNADGTVLSSQPLTVSIGRTTQVRALLVN